MLKIRILHRLRQALGALLRIKMALLKVLVIDPCRAGLSKGIKYVHVAALSLFLAGTPYSSTVSAIMKDLAVASASSVVVTPAKNGVKPADETGNGEFLQYRIFNDLS